MRRWLCLLLPLIAALSLQTLLASPPRQTGATSRSRGKPVVAIVRMPYVGERNVSELSPGPDALLAGGLVAALEQAGADVKTPGPAVKLSAAEEKQYGAWQRLALANAHLAHMVGDSIRNGELPVALLANCSSLLGVLAGVQHSGPAGAPVRVGLVYVDAHADFNTPETTLSGMLGGMDVAAAAGLCLTRLRTTSGLDRPLPVANILFAGVRDTDPLEQQLIERHAVARVSAPDLRQRSSRFRAAIARLASRVDRIYVHIDMDVLDPAEVPGHSLSVPGGPTSAELGAAVAEMFRDRKAAAIGIASTPTGERDREGRSQRAAYELIKSAVAGIQQRQGR